MQRPPMIRAGTVPTPPDGIDAFLSALAASPAEVMDRVPEKRTLAGAPSGRPLSAFSAESIASADYVLQRDRIRSRLYVRGEGGRIVTVADLVTGKAPIHANDRAADLVDVLRYDNPADMDAAGLTRARLAETPWSSDYWPTYLGLLGRRYADPSYPDNDDWKDNHEYVARTPAASVIASGDAAAIDLLSPSEKYDLLVGDPAGSLTAAMWGEGERAYAADGHVEKWMGVCHGWAPASYMLPRPRRVVIALCPDGTEVRLYPSDVEALASLLWANSGPAVRFIGGRCTEKHPKKDENGRVLSDDCFDTNPGTWHLAVVNQIGVAGRAFIMDATYDYEVWNQPVCGYAYRYFNPQTMRATDSLDEATVARGDFDGDRFARYRSTRCASMVGVAMKVRYVGETPPSHARTDGPRSDRVVTVDYVYDLELDQAGRIAGGEWYENRHPDFLWTPDPGERADTPADAFAQGTWRSGQAVPQSWQRAAVRAAVDGLPLAKIVERLIALSR